MLEKLILGDCIEEMKKITSKSANLVLTDPPYNISKNNNFTTMGRSGIDFGAGDKNVNITSYISEVFRILDKNGFFYCF